MRAFKGYHTHNERRTQILNDLERLFNVMNNGKKGSGYNAEEEICKRYRTVAISELSTATLIKEYERLIGK